MEFPWTHYFSVSLFNQQSRNVFLFLMFQSKTGKISVLISEICDIMWQSHDTNFWARGRDKKTWFWYQNRDINAPEATLMNEYHHDKNQIPVMMNDSGENAGNITPLMTYKRKRRLPLYLSNISIVYIYFIIGYITSTIVLTLLCTSHMILCIIACWLVFFSFLHVGRNARGCGIIQYAWQ